MNEEKAKALGTIGATFTPLIIVLMIKWPTLLGIIVPTTILGLMIITIAWLSSFGGKMSLEIGE